MIAFPLVTATFAQAAAYADHAIRARDIGAAVWGAIFLMVCILPATILDLFALPARLSATRHRERDRPRAAESRAPGGAIRR
jgi:hypothetical protein